MKDRIDSLLDALDGSGSDAEHRAIDQLRCLHERLPELLLEKFQRSKTWATRASCVFYSMRYARTVDAAFQLGVLALRDKSKVVRYRATMLLAYSLNRNALPILKSARASETNVDTLKDIDAAIDAIEQQNSNFFVDRAHTGKITLKIPLA